MRRRFGLVLILLPLLVRQVPAVSPHELPLGADMLRDFGDSSLAALNRDLGFNLIKEYIQTGETLARMRDHGVKLIAGSLVMNAYTPERLSYAHYMKLEVGTSNSSLEDSFFSLGAGAVFTSDTWISTAADTLVGLNTKHYPPRGNSPYLRPCLECDRNYEGYKDETGRYRGFLQDGPVFWHLAIRLKIDELGDPLDTVARIEGWPAPCWAGAMPAAAGPDWTVLDIGAIVADSFKLADTYETLTFSFTIPETVRYVGADNVPTYMVLPHDEPNGGTIGFNLRFYTTGRRRVTVDWLRLSETWGERLMAGDPEIINGINEFLERCNSTGGDGIYAFYLRDEPVWSNYQPFGKIDSLIRAVNPAWRHHTIMSNPSTAGSYLYWSGAEYIDLDYYPLGSLHSHTGFDPEPENIAHQKYQNRLQLMAYQLYLVRLKADLMGRRFWLTPQAFWEINCDRTPDLSSPDRDCAWRKPSQSELWCLTDICLCYGAQGLIYWKYDPNGGDGQFPGFRMQTPEGRLTPTDLYYKMKNDIAPYIKAIDSIYLSLDWKRAYTYNPVFGFNPPREGLLDSISAFNIGSGPNPDLGWFHVGEFGDKSGGHYFMLVNRACSRGLSDSSEAPPIRALVQLKSEEVGSAHALIIDLAKGTSADNWLGFPETTYVAARDGRIRFATELQAGEGRLFKVIPVLSPVIRNPFD